MLLPGADGERTLMARDRDAERRMRVPLGCEAIDDLLGGGVESGALTEFYGEAGAGKTNACLQLARNVARAGRKVVYIDTEGVSMERLQQMCGADYSRVHASILFFEPFSLREQEQVIEKAVRLAASADVGLLVLDSATLLYRITLGSGDDVAGRRILANQLQQLVAVARKRDVPVVMTNQVFTNVDKNDELEPVGGQLIRHITKAVLRFEKTGLGKRRATVIKHRSAPEGLAAEFVIAASGLETPGGEPTRRRADAPALLASHFDEAPTTLK